MERQDQESLQSGMCFIVSLTVSQKFDPGISVSQGFFVLGNYSVMFLYSKNAPRRM